MKKLLIIVLVVAFGASGFALWKIQELKVEASVIWEPASLSTESIDEPEYLYGFRIDSLIIYQDRIRINQSISDILLPRAVSHQKIFQLANNSKEVFDVRKIKSGKEYTLMLRPDSTVDKLIYEANEVEYVVFHLDDSAFVEKREREVQQVRKTISGVIEKSVAVTISELGAPVELTNKFVDAFAWEVDFLRLQKGDHFTIIYIEDQVEEVPIGISQIEAIYFNHYGNDFWGYAYDQGEGLDYFDEDGNSLRKSLLKYPLEFSRISSGYSLRRFHPVQKRYKAHKGTDFAASTGTPIRSVGSGIITEATYKSANGNYVKIRHNATYTTQYLHMSKIASGIKPGVKVKQGQLIGFVGSTGLATGSHLCYRFWKNGVQVNAMTVDLPPASPIKEDQKEKFTEVKDILEGQLKNAMPLPL